MVLFTALWIFWNKSASHDLLKITVTSLLLIHLPDHKRQKRISRMSPVPETGAFWATAAARSEPAETGAAVPPLFQAGETLILWSHQVLWEQQDAEVTLDGVLHSLRKALRFVRLFIPGVTMDTLLICWSEKQRMTPNIPQIHYIRDRKVKMSDSYGQRKLLNEKPNCFAVSTMKLELSFLWKEIYT